MKNKNSDLDFLCRMLNGNLYPANQSRMSETKQAQGHGAHIVKIYPGMGVTEYHLFEFGHKENKDLLPFFNSTNNEPGKPNAPKWLLKFCDYMILAECKGDLYIILIEMKRGNSSADTAMIQLDAANTFMDFVLATAERIKKENNMDDFDSTRVKYRRVILEKVAKESLRSHLPFDTGERYITYKSKDIFDIRRSIG